LVPLSTANSATMGNEVSVCGPKSMSNGSTIGPGPIDYSVSADLGYATAPSTPAKPSFSVANAEPSLDLLHKAAASGSISNLQKVIAAKRIALDCSDDRGNTALHKAAWHGKMEAVRLLVKHGAKTNIANATGKTPLAFAKQMGHAECAEYLAEMMQRHSPEKIKSMFRAKGKTSNCPRVFGARQSMKATAWLIPGAPEVAEVQAENQIAIGAVLPLQQNASSATQVPQVVHSTPCRVQSGGSPAPVPHRTSNPHAVPLPSHQLPPSVVCTVSSRPGVHDQRTSQALQVDTSADRKVPMPKLDLSDLGNRAAKPVDEDALSGRSTSRREEIPEGMWKEEQALSTPAVTNTMAPHRTCHPVPVAVERCVQGVHGRVSVVQVPRAGMPSRVQGSHAPRAPSMALV